MTATWPAYRVLLEDGELARRAALAVARLERCDLCARRCAADRIHAVARASCRIGRWAAVHSCGPSHGDEACLSGSGGSGAILFSGCNMRCLACSTAEASWQGVGQTVDAAGLAGMMLSLQAQGCHNINLVSPSHVAAQILEALALAAAAGLRLPLVWNSGGFDAPETLALLDGIVDIYLPDAKHGDDRVARVCTGVNGYATASRIALAEMHRQVGPLELDCAGIARRGLLVRHLVLPGGLAGTEAVLAGLPAGTAVNVMGSYTPCWRAPQHPLLRRPVEDADVATARQMAHDAGLRLVT